MRTFQKSRLVFRIAYLICLTAVLYSPDKDSFFISRWSNDFFFISCGRTPAFLCVHRQRLCFIHLTQRLFFYFFSDNRSFFTYPFHFLLDNSYFFSHQISTIFFISPQATAAFYFSQHKGCSSFLTIRRLLYIYIYI